MMRRRRRSLQQLLDDFKETKRNSTRSHCVHNRVWKGLWNCTRRDKVMVTVTVERQVCWGVIVITLEMSVYIGSVQLMARCQFLSFFSWSAKT